MFQWLRQKFAFLFETVERAEVDIDEGEEEDREEDRWWQAIK